MDIRVTARRIEIHDQLKDYIDAKVSKLTRIYPGLIEASVVVEQDRYQFVTELSVHSKPFDIFSRSQHQDVKQSILSAVRKAERQLRRHKERLQEHKGRGQPEAET